MKKKNYNFTFTDCIKNKIIKPKNILELRKYLKKKFTIVGNLRSYGDCAIGKKKHISLKNFNKIINLDKKKKIIEVQSGISLIDLLQFSLKKNLSLECMPGCKYVSLGGMIANNISGKLTKKNKFKEYICSIKLIKNNGKIVECSKKSKRKLFDLTIGGRGKTGPILSAKIKLTKIKSLFIYEKRLIFNSYNDFVNKLTFYKKFKYCVVWIDFISKDFEGIFFLGRHHFNNRKFKIFKYNDFRLPNFFITLISPLLISKFFSQIFNKIIFLKNFLKKTSIVDFNTFFFPQNKLKNWNLFFLNSGFLQFQIYFPFKNLYTIIESLKLEMSSKNIYSNFAIIKFHEFNKLSLSLDFPIKNNKDKIIHLINNFSQKYNLEVELSKDISLKKINKKTLLNNKIFDKKNRKYWNKNFNSKFYERLS